MGKAEVQVGQGIAGFQDDAPGVRVAAGSPSEGVRPTDVGDEEGGTRGEFQAEAPVAIRPAQCDAVERAHEDEEPRPLLERDDPRAGNGKSRRVPHPPRHDGARLRRS